MIDKMDDKLYPFDKEFSTSGIKSYQIYRELPFITKIKNQYKGHYRQLNFNDNQEFLGLMSLLFLKELFQQNNVDKLILYQQQRYQINKDDRRLEWLKWPIQIYEWTQNQTQPQTKTQIHNLWDYYLEDKYNFYKYLTFVLNLEHQIIQENKYRYRFNEKIIYPQQNCNLTNQIIIDDQTAFYLTQIFKISFEQFQQLQNGKWQKKCYLFENEQKPQLVLIILQKFMYQLKEEKKELNKYRSITFNKKIDQIENETIQKEKDKIQIQQQEIFLPSSDFIIKPSIDIKTKITKKCQEEGTKIQQNEELEKEDQKQQPKRKINLNPTLVKLNNKEENKECSICYEMFDKTEEILFPCNHKLHKYCVAQTFENKESKFLQDYNCPICFQVVNVQILTLLVCNAKLYEILLASGTSNIEKIEYCPYENCSIPFDFKINELNQTNEQQNFYDCCGCKQKICLLCFQKFHGVNQKGNPCPKKRNAIMAALKGEQHRNKECNFDMSVCPKCQAVALKDNGCNHVTCPSCKTDYCFACSANRTIISAHGNQYHRAGCVDYRNLEDPQTKKESFYEEYAPNKCKFCKESQKPCPRPMPLKEFYDLNPFLKA